jgi:hypothetical protein
MSDPEVVNTQNEPDDAAIAAEVAELTASPADQQAEKIKNALITAKRDLRVSNRRVKELEPVAARASEIDERLNSAQPVINAILSNPKLRAEALRIASGTHTSARSRRRSRQRRRGSGRRRLRGRRGLFPRRQRDP